MSKTNVRIDYAKQFLKQLKKAPLAIKIQFKNRFILFIKDPFHPQLNNHALRGKFQGYRSINITGDWRAIYTITQEKSQQVVVFELLGTHSQLYR